MDSASPSGPAPGGVPSAPASEEALLCSSCPFLPEASVSPSVIREGVLQKVSGLSSPVPPALEPRAWPSVKFSLWKVCPLLGPDIPAA